MILGKKALSDRARWVSKQDWFRFILVGVSAFVVDMVFSNIAFFLLDRMGQPLHIRSNVGFVAGVLVAMFYAFFLNKIWSFQDRQKAVTRQGVLFFIGRGITLGVTFVFNMLIVQHLTPSSRFHLAENGLLLSVLAHLGKTATPGLNQSMDFFISKVFNGLLSFVLNYTWAKFLVFRPSKTEPSPATIHAGAPKTPRP